MKFYNEITANLSAQPEGLVLQPWNTTQTAQTGGPLESVHVTHGTQDENYGQQQ